MNQPLALVLLALSYLALGLLLQSWHAFLIAATFAFFFLTAAVLIARKTKNGSQS